MIVYLKKNYLLIVIFFNLFCVFPTHTKKILNITHLYDPAGEVSYLEFPEETLNLIEARRQAGFFKKIEYGCYHTLRSKQGWEILLHTLFLWSVVCLRLLLFSEQSIITYAICFIYAIFSAIIFIAANSIYDTYQYPGFWLLTDKGMLLVNPGSSPLVVFLSYHDILSVDNIPLPREAVSPNYTFLRIITKEGKLLEYKSDLFASEKVFNEFCSKLKQKLEEQPIPSNA